jgi:beta-N-acetylhexosaminidase
VLRNGLGFTGAIISDDLAMLGAAALGDLDARLQAHRAAGCDLLLVCEPDQVDAALAQSARWRPKPEPRARVRALRADRKLRLPSARQLTRHWKLLQELLAHG